MNTSNLAGHNAPSANDQFLPVTAYVLDCFQAGTTSRPNDVQLGDVLTIQDGRITGYWSRV
jgi:hypothetical protein